jgi:hypothetical protein
VSDRDLVFVVLMVTYVLILLWVIGRDWIEYWKGK